MSARIDGIETMCFVLLKEQLGLTQGEISVRMGRNRKSVQQALLKYENNPGDFEQYREQAKAELIRKGFLVDSAPSDLPVAKSELPSLPLESAAEAASPSSEQGGGGTPPAPPQPSVPEDLRPVLFGESVVPKPIRPDIPPPEPVRPIKDNGGNNVKEDKTMDGDYETKLDKMIDRTLEKKVSERVQGRGRRKQAEVPDEYESPEEDDVFGFGPTGSVEEEGEEFDLFEAFSEMEKMELRALDKALTLYGVKRELRNVIITSYRAIDEIHDYREFLHFLSEMPAIGPKRAKYISDVFFGMLNKLAKQREEAERMYKQAPSFYPMSNTSDYKFPNPRHADKYEKRYDDNVPSPPPRGRQMDDVYAMPYGNGMEPYVPARSYMPPYEPPYRSMPYDYGSRYASVPDPEPVLSKEDIEEEINKRVEEQVRKIREEEARKREEEERRRREKEEMDARINAIQQEMRAGMEMLAKRLEQIGTAAPKEKSFQERVMEKIVEDRLSGTDKEREEKYERLLQGYRDTIESLKEEIRNAKTRSEQEAMASQIASLRNEVSNSIKELEAQIAMAGGNGLSAEDRLKLIELKGKFDTMAQAMSQLNNTVTTGMKIMSGMDTTGQIKQGNYKLLNTQWDEKTIRELDKELEE